MVFPMAGLYPKPKGGTTGPAGRLALGLALGADAFQVGQLLAQRRGRLGEDVLDQSRERRRSHRLLGFNRLSDLLLDGGAQRAVGRVIQELRDMGFDYIVCDSPAGIETGALMAMHYADEALIVTNPEVSSVRDSDRILGILASKTKRFNIVKGVC